MPPTAASTITAAPARTRRQHDPGRRGRQRAAVRPPLGKRQRLLRHGTDFCQQSGAVGVQLFRRQRFPFLWNGRCHGAGEVWVIRELFADAIGLVLRKISTLQGPDLLDGRGWSDPFLLLPERVAICLLPLRFADHDSSPNPSNSSPISLRNSLRARLSLDF